MKRVMCRSGALVVAAGFALSAAGTATGQVLVSQDFEGSTYGGWTVNGNEMVFPEGNPGLFMGVPLLDFWGITLGNSDPTSPALGNLTVYPALTVAVDIRVFILHNWFGEPMDPGQFPVVLEFVDHGDPENCCDSVSVYYTGPGMPAIAQGWTRFVYSVPDPTQTALPPGWGGTGAEDPVTFEPILPPGRTYRSVLESVDEVRVTTMRPGYFYASSFWEAGFDNLLINVPATCGSADFDGDGDTGTDADIEAYFACLGGSCCATCGSADFDGDGDTGTDADIEAFFRVLGGGNC